MKKTHFLLAVAVFAAVGSMLFVGNAQKAHAICASCASDPECPLYPTFHRSILLHVGDDSGNVIAGQNVLVKTGASNNSLDCNYDESSANIVVDGSTNRIVIKVLDSAKNVITPGSSSWFWVSDVNGTQYGKLSNNEGYKLKTITGNPNTYYNGNIQFSSSLIGSSVYVKVTYQEFVNGVWTVKAGTKELVTVDNAPAASLSLLVDGKTSESVSANTPYYFSLSGSNLQPKIDIRSTDGYSKTGLPLGTNVASDQRSSAGSYTYSASGKDTSGNTVNSNDVVVTVSGGGTCQSGSVSANPPSINVGNTTALSAPSGWSNVTFSSNNTGVLSVSGTTGTGRSAGTANVSGSGTDANGTTGCSLNPVTVSVTPTCTDTTWSPAASTQCNGVSFTQTSNCGNTQGATGTATCYACSGSSCNPVSYGVSGYISNTCNGTCSSVTTYNCSSGYQCVSVSGSGGAYSSLSNCQTACVAPPTGSCSLTANPTSGTQPLTTTFTISGANPNAAYGYIYNGSRAVSGQINLSGGNGSKTLTLSTSGNYYFADFDGAGNMYDTQCGYPTTVTVYTPSFTLSPPSATVQVGVTQQYTGYYDPDGPSGPQPSQTVAATSVTWSSSDTSKATINSSGLATGVAAGSTTIRGTYNGITATALLTVNSATNPDFTVAVTPGLQGVNQGSFVDYNVTVTPSNGFTGTVNLSVLNWGNGSGLSGSFDPSSVTITSGMPAVGSTLAISAAANAAPGRSTFTVLGKSGANSKQASADIEVVQADRYSCSSNYQCVLDSGGIYSTLGGCQTACVQPSCTLSASPQNILRGMSSQLTWTCSGSGISATTSCLLSGPSGSVASGLNVASGGTGVFVRPAQTTKYDLTCGLASSNATVYVGFFTLLREIIPRW